MTRRALWVTPVSNLAGVSRHVLDAVREGIPGYTVTVAAPKGDLLDELQRMDVPHREVPLDQSPAQAVKLLRATIQEARPAVVHSHLAKADFLTAAATVGLPCKVVSTEHGIAADAQLYNRGKSKATIRRALHHLRSRRFDALIAVSESTKREMLRAWKPTTPIDVILNGVDRPRTTKNEPGARFLSLARLAPEKRIPAALKAFAAVSRELQDATMTIAGDGPDRDALVQLAGSLGIAHKVEFPGYVDANGALSSHDVLVQLSAWENASYSILDAVVHGLGVVATPVGGNPEILPAQCLSEADNQSRLQQLLREQATDLSQRPMLPDYWPSVAEMTHQISDLYERILR